MINKNYFLKLSLFLFILSCDNLFTRFKYETYECGKNQLKLKQIFIKNYKPGELVDIEINDGAFKMEIIENSDEYMTIQRSDPNIFVKIDKKASILEVNLNNIISKVKCENFTFKM